MHLQVERQHFYAFCNTIFRAKKKRYLGFFTKSFHQSAKIAMATARYFKYNNTKTVKSTTTKSNIKQSSETITMQVTSRTIHICVYIFNYERQGKASRLLGGKTTTATLGLLSATSPSSSSSSSSSSFHRQFSAATT